jgi:hypothetical protein
LVSSAVYGDYPEREQHTPTRTATTWAYSSALRQFSFLLGLQRSQKAQP